MNHNLTDITVVLDRSGSMSMIRSDAEGGLNEFIKDQKEDEGDCLFTLVQFDTEYEFVCKAEPIQRVKKCNLIPRGATALLDAVGRAIVETGERLNKIAEKDRPALVTFVIITDGLENSSKEYSKKRIKEMIQHQQEKYGWKFIFLAANQDAFAEGRSMGIDAVGTQTIDYHRTATAFKNTSDNIKRMKAAVRGGASGQSVACSFTKEEVASMAPVEYEESD